jgi:hypothetical protein
MIENTDLSKKMIARADRDGLTGSHDLRIKAHAFNEAYAGIFSDPPTCTTPKFMGCWARARVAWCNYTGEPLLSI